MPVNSQTLAQADGILLQAKYNNACKHCGRRFVVGQDQIVWVPSTKEVFCSGTCVPSNITVRAPSPNFLKNLGLGALNQATRKEATAPVARAPLNRKLAALVLLEEELIDLAAKQGLTQQIQTQWEKYTKRKAMALSPGNEHEQRLGMKNALLELIKAVF